MTDLAIKFDSSTAQATRPLALKMRPDLVCCRQSFQGRECWVVKDPIALKYYRFENEEFTLLTLLDGRRSARDLVAEFQRRFAPQQLALGDLDQLIGMLHRSALVISDNVDQGEILYKRTLTGVSSQRRARWMNLLVIQFRGVDPDALLQRASRWMGWLFTRSALCGALLLWLAAILLVATHWDELQQRLPGFREFFHARNWLPLAMTLAATKVLHELGHGVACRRFGGQVSELGVMLLVFTPCLYCNVSDSWMLPNKWQRIAIGAAGMYVECILAAICALVWWFTQDGLLNQLALNVMFVSSISTLAFNANPLMRYDGYYLLSDWLEIPNLRQKATTLWRQAIASWFLGQRPRTDPFLPTRGRPSLMVYGLAAVWYRVFITVAIFLFLNKVLEPYGLQIVGQILAAMLIAAFLIGPVVGLVRFVSIHGRSRMIKSSRVGLAAAIAAGVLLAVLAIPVPHYVRCPLHVRAAHGQNVYVERGGRIAEILVQPHQVVAAGDPLLRLEDPTIASEVASLEGRRDVAQARLASSQRLLDADRHRFAPDVAADRTRVAAYTSLIEQREHDAEQLVVRTPAAGKLLPPDRLASSPADGRLHAWEGRLLDARNRGAYAARGSIIGQIVPVGDTTQAILAIDQQNIEFVQPGQRVEIWLTHRPNQTYFANVAAVSNVRMSDVPKCLSSQCGGSLATIPDADGNLQPREPTYQVTVPLAATADEIAPGATGFARIRVGSRSVGSRIWRLVCQTLRFEL